MNEKLHITIKDNRLKVMINSNDTFGIFGSNSAKKTASITSHDWFLVFDNDTENLSPIFLSPESSILLVCDTIICKIHISVTTVNFTEPPRNDSLLDNTNIKSNKGCKCSELEDDTKHSERPHNDTFSSSTSHSNIAQGCDVRCFQHGKCDDNQQCHCSPGWNGRLCTIPGCPNYCHQNGECLLAPRNTIFSSTKEWRCVCRKGWEGDDCSYQTELQCDDGLDNDDDGLKDCEDPECCEQDVCVGKQLCTFVEDLKDLRQHGNDGVPAEKFHASFWDRINFLVAENGTQRYVVTSSLVKDYVCVARGQVVTKHNRGLPGVRISRQGHLSEGFTLSRKDGYFDFVGNCNENKMKLKFGKSPFPYQTKLFDVLPNQIIVLGKIKLDKSGIISALKQNNNSIPLVDGATKPVQSELCLSHNYTSNTISMIVKENQGERGQYYKDTMNLEQSPLSLKFVSYERNSSDTGLVVQLLGPYFPTALWKVQLEISIEGHEFKETLEPERELKYRLLWNKYDIYGQKVYGR